MKENKIKSIEIRLTEKEKQIIQQYCEDKCVNMSKWIRKVLFAEVEKNAKSN